MGEMVKVLWTGEVRDGDKIYESIWRNEYGTTMVRYRYQWEHGASQAYELAADQLVAYLARKLNDAQKRPEPAEVAAGVEVGDGQA